MPKEDEASVAGIEIAVRAFEKFNGLRAVSSDPPKIDAYEPEFWYPGSVWAEIEDSEDGRYLEGFLTHVQGRWEFPTFGLRCLELGLEGDGEQSQAVARFYLFDPDDVDEVFAWFAEFLIDLWGDYAKSR
ncbi:MAG: hypothetical protein ACI8UO_005559 [Verrucomicrobiales bacterium]|jgi:hypothetical protein